MTISAPHRQVDHPDRTLDAQEAIEASFLVLVDQAVAAGWGELEAIAAIIALAENRALALAENQKVGDTLKQLRE